MHNRDDADTSRGKKMSTKHMVALGATGVALTAGVVAAGVALSNRKNRTKLKASVKKGTRALKAGIRKVGEEYKGMYQGATNLRVGKTRSSSSSSRTHKSRGRKKSS